MPRVRHHEVHWLLWPLAALWDLVARLLEISGRLVGLVVGGALTLCGVILSITVIAAPIGIPLAILGFLIMLRSIF